MLFKELLSMIKSKKGFTLIEIVVVLAMLSILAHVAFGDFSSSTYAARGSKVVSDMRKIESAISTYYQKNNIYPASKSDTLSGNSVSLESLVIGGWPTPPSGEFTIPHDDDSTEKSLTSGTLSDSASYEYLPNDSSDLINKPGHVYLSGATISSSIKSDDNGYSLYNLLTGEKSSN